MITNDLPLPDAGSRRIPFAQATALQVSRAITDANERLVLHFPSLSWPTWSETLLQVQPDLLVNGKDVSLDWPDLSRLVQRLAAARELPLLDPPVHGPAAGEVAHYVITNQRQAIRTLTELLENPRACGPLVYELVTLLAKGLAAAEDIYDATHEAGERRQHSPSPEAIEKLLQSVDAARRVTDSAVAGAEVTGLVNASARSPLENIPTQSTGRSSSARRTFRAMVQHHRRSNGKIGFTVRELCTTMRISAASLTEARANPGRLSLDAVMALAGAMGEFPLQVITDLLAEAKRKSGRGK
jgi:hypothetical protein